MRRLILVLLWLFCGLADAQQVIRVATWNLKWFPGGRPNADASTKEAHIAQVASEVAKFKADVLLFQEVSDAVAMDRLTQHSHFPPGFTNHVVSTFKDQFSGAQGQQQLAILSRFPALSAWSEPWKRGWANAPRGYAYARLQVGDGKFLNVYTLHLKSNLGDPAANTSKREDAAGQLLLHVQSQCGEKEAIVVGGDFNTSLDDSRFAGDSTLRKIQKAGFFWTFEGMPHSDRITIPAYNSYPDACFDHLFSRNLGRPIARVCMSPGSDHRPVLVDVVME